MPISLLNLTTRKLLLFSFFALLSACGWSLESVEKTSDPDKLSNIFIQSTKDDVREAALIKSEDQKLLLQVAEGRYSNKRPNFGLIAISKLSDKSLAALFSGDFEPVAAQRIAALEAFDDQNVLAGLVMKSSEDRAKEFLTYMNEANAIKVIIGNHTNFDIRSAAFKQITDQQGIFEILMARKHGESLRIDGDHAVNILHDEKLITTYLIERTENENSNRTPQTIEMTLIDRVEDQKLLSLIAQKAVWRLGEIALKKLTDQDALRQVFLNSRSWNFKELAVERMTNPAFLIEAVAKAPSDNLQRKFSSRLDEIAPNNDELYDQWGAWFLVDRTAQVKDQAVLAEIALGANRSAVRQTATEKLHPDHEALREIAVKDRKRGIREIAMEKIDDQALYAARAENDETSDVRMFAAQRLTDPKLIKDVVQQKGLKESRYATSRKTNRDVRLFLLSKVEDQEFLKSIVAGAQYDLDFKRTALSRIKDQPYLKALISTENAELREAVVTFIKDDDFLLSLIIKEPSAAVRLAIVDSLIDFPPLVIVAEQGFWTADREAAIALLEYAHPETLSEAVDVHKKIADYATQLRSGDIKPDEGVTKALTGEYDVWRTSAAQGLNDVAPIGQVALGSTDRDVLRIILEKISNHPSIDKQADIVAQIVSGAAAPSMQLAVSEWAGLTSWDKIFANATATEATPEMLEHALKAVNLYTTKVEGVKDAVQKGALELIRNGDEARIIDLGDMLENYGDRQLAEDYLNSGNPDLANAGQAWARKSGFNVNTGPRGSNRALWGSRRR